jgi:hypothetical protein
MAATSGDVRGKRCGGEVVTTTAATVWVGNDEGGLRALSAEPRGVAC